MADISMSGNEQRLLDKEIMCPTRRDIMNNNNGPVLIYSTHEGTVTKRIVNEYLKLEIWIEPVRTYGEVVGFTNLESFSKFPEGTQVKFTVSFNRQNERYVSSFTRL